MSFVATSGGRVVLDLFGIAMDLQLVLVIGDFHIPHRANALPPQFKKLLVSLQLANQLENGSGSC